MRIFAENENNDLELSANNQLEILVDLPATLQACASAVEAQRGEMQYSAGRGVPTEATLWTGPPDQTRFRFYAVQAIQAVSGVLEVSQFNSEILDDVLSYEAIIVTEFGTGTIGNIIDGI